MPINPLSVFYSVLDRWQLHPSGYVDILWKCDPQAIREIGKAGNMDISAMSLVNINEVNHYFARLLVADAKLTAIVVDNLYRMALKQPTPMRNNCWFSFITVMTANVTLHIWNKVPKPQQSEELFERLVTPNISVSSLLDGFNPQYQPNLLVGLQAWAYKTIKYKSFTDLRANGNPYFGLSNLGIVRRSSYKLMREALLGNSTESEIEAYLSICKVFKTYLDRSKLGTNKLELSHWQDILDAGRSIDGSLNVDRLRSIIDRVGGLIRTYCNPIIERYDDVDRQFCLDPEDILPEIDISESILSELFDLIDRFIKSLPAESIQIIQLRHHQKLKHKDIAAIVPRDQPYISKHLGKIYLKLLDLIHSQVSHPDDRQKEKNSLALKAIEQLLEQYFHQKR
jgi:serine/threonine protein kinase